MLGFFIMLPVLFSIGPISVSSFGFFLSLAFLYATFLAWRLARAWDLDEEKILDICLLTFFGGLLGARLLFVILNLEFFLDDPFKMALLTKYPGLNFWGGVAGGGATLYFFTQRVKKINFWQVADLASVGLLAGLILGNIGCFLGGCNVGVQSSLPVAISMIGYVAKRLPVQILEALVFAVILVKIWPLATHFHFTGKILSLTLILLGVVELLLNPFKDIKVLEWTFPTVVFGLGIFSFYSLSKRSLKIDLIIFGKLLMGFFTDGKVRLQLLNKFKKSWYNQKVAFVWSLHQIKRKLRRARVKTTPGNI